MERVLEQLKSFRCFEKIEKCGNGIDNKKLALYYSRIKYNKTSFNDDLSYI